MRLPRSCIENRWTREKRCWETNSPIRTGTYSQKQFRERHWCPFANKDVDAKLKGKTKTHYGAKAKSATSLQ